MSMIQMNMMARTVYWVTCSYSDCAFEMEPTLDYDEADRKRTDHWHYHEQRRKEQYVGKHV
jgi:hypothetical protein